MTEPSQGSVATETDGATEKAEGLTDVGQNSNRSNAEVAGDSAEDESKEPIKRIRDYLLSIIAIIVYVIIIGIIYKYGGFRDSTNFTLQKYVFSLGALVALITGLNFGYMNPKEKSFWAITDMLWISMAVVSLSGILNPVENIVLKGEVWTAAYVSEGKRELIANDITLAVKSLCASQSTSQQCKDWTLFSNNVDASRVDPKTLYGRANGLELPKLPTSLASKPYRDAIEEKLKSLKQSIEREQRAQSRLDDANIGWAYAKLFLLVVALGLRAGKTGAELRNNPPKTPWRQKIINLSKRLRLKSR